MEKKVAFIGTGAMGGAIIRAACRSIDPGQVLITDHVKEKAMELAMELGCTAVSSNLAAAEQADCIMLCIKPQNCTKVVSEIAPTLLASLKSGKPKLLYSIMTGVTIETIRQVLCEPSYPVIRIMPNTPALVGKGLMLFTCDETVSADDIADLKEIIADCGLVDQLDESLFDQATVSSACSPAFVYMFIEALSDGGVAIGLNRVQAQTFAARAVYGAAAMVMETGMHPGALKDMVTSPGGSTIAGVAELEDKSFRRAIINAVIASYHRNVEMGKLDT